jgi:hypothetical protein
MISIGQSTTGQHILDRKTEKALCGFPSKFKAILEVERLEDVRDPICKRCRSIAETGGRAEPMHLKHKRSLMVELKDKLLTGEISYQAFRNQAYPLQKEIQAMEAGPA